MTKTIANTETTLSINDSIFAYKDGKMYQIWETDKSFLCGGLLGSIQFIFAENGEELACAYPLLGFNNDFRRIPIEEINLMKNFIKAFDEMTN